MTAQPLPALASGDPSAWDQGLYAFLIEKGNRSGSRRTVESEYQTERDSIQAALAQLPDGDRIRTFDAYRARLLALPAAIAAASPARREELCRIVVEQVVVNDRVVEDIVWTPPARPFFEKQREYPQADSNR
jgi:hypothetical protein